MLQDTYIINILSFSIQQAILSSLASVVLGYLSARILFYGQCKKFRKIFLSLCLLSFILPSFILISGILSLFGAQGILQPWLPADWQLYGLSGILIAHLWLNFPFALRIFSINFQAIDHTSWQLARQLKFSRWQLFCLLEWPRMRASFFGLLGLIFLLCFNSFAVVLTLGGGPKSSTLEVAIFQALKYDFNLGEALILSWLQFGIASLAFLISLKLGKLVWLSSGEHQAPSIFPVSRFTFFSSHIFYIGLCLIILLPLIALLMQIELSDLVNYAWLSLLEPLVYTITLAGITALLAFLMTSLFLPTFTSTWQNTSYFLACIGLLTPAMVIAVGVYAYLLGKQVSWFTTPSLWIILINTLLTLPYLVNQVRSPYIVYHQHYNHLQRQLKLSFFKKFTIATQWLSPYWFIGTLVTFLFALGDVSVFAIFGQSDSPTLPWLIYRYASTYKLADAAITSWVLLFICILFVFLLEHYLQAKYEVSIYAKNQST
ncbi:ABC transporter permease subunit [Allopseudospirillum japonicum]|uniref:ABC transporter permease subunit n=1 Tax=Allopseudospirillum japonicum TaxID=64971 RepID=UPI0015A65DD0|nr:ABC transporter permease subunit [Allopseudospirillum japonicum]